MKTTITSLAAILIFSVSSFAHANTDIVIASSNNETSATVSAAAYAQLAAENFTLQLQLDEMQSETDNLNSLLDYSKMMNTTLVNLNNVVLEEQEEDNTAKMTYASMMSTTLVNLNTELQDYILYQ